MEWFHKAHHTHLLYFNIDADSSSISVWETSTKPPLIWELSDAWDNFLGAAPSFDFGLLWTFLIDRLETVVYFAFTSSSNPPSLSTIFSEGDFFYKNEFFILIDYFENFKIKNHKILHFNIIIKYLNKAWLK